MMAKINIEYFRLQCKELFSDELIFIFNTDSYIRQPCYSSRARDFYYLVLANCDDSTLSRIKYLQGEFPELFINYISIAELHDYPAQGKWQFVFSAMIYAKDGVKLLEASMEDNLQAISQAIVGVGHIARLYYLRSLKPKTYTWGVRQLGWAMRYAENVIVKLSNYILTHNYNIEGLEPDVSNDVSWLVEVNLNWEMHEKLLLAEPYQYQQYALRLNKIVQCFSRLLAPHYENKYYVHDKANSADDPKFASLASLKSDMTDALGDNLLALYVSGSAARGDQHARSDVDTIGVFASLDSEVLDIVRDVLKKHENTSVYSLSLNDLAVYPRFRYYMLNESTVKIAGTISLLPKQTTPDYFQSIGNNIFTILQISRSYLVLNSFGQRAVHLLRLMMKLADHGCMRPYIQLKKGEYPKKKQDVCEFFNDGGLPLEIINIVDDMNAYYDANLLALKQGNTQPVIDGFALLNKFVAEFMFLCSDIQAVGED